jgi:hypothetical protein
MCVILYADIHSERTHVPPTAHAPCTCSFFKSDHPFTSVFMCDKARVVKDVTLACVKECCQLYYRYKMEKSTQQATLLGLVGEVLQSSRSKFALLIPSLERLWGELAKVLPLLLISNRICVVLLF